VNPSLVIAAALAAAQAGGPATLRTIPVEAGWSAGAVTLADLDGDGAREVLVALHADERAFERRLEAWRSKGAELERVTSLALTRDVVAFAHGDVLEGGGEELVLFNAGGAFALRFAEEARPVRLLAADFLWQAADPEEVFHWEGGVRDLDGDGLADLVLPEPDGFAIAVQRRAEDAASFGVVSRVRVPREATEPGERERGDRRGGGRARREDGSFSIGLEIAEDEAEDEGRGPLVSVDEHVPAPAWLDWDADGDLDLLLQTRTLLDVWIQDAGAFTEAPRLSLVLPVAAGRARELDVSYSAHAVDLDRDARADYAVFASDKASDDVRTQGLFYAQAAVETGPPPFGTEGTPASLLVFAGFLSNPQFRDLDGDELPELVVQTFRPDLIDQIRSAASESIEIEMFVYRNKAGTFARKPELARRFDVALDDDEGELELEFLGDLTGDRLAELLVRERPDRVRVLSMRAASGRETGWTLLEKPLWELGIAKEARLEVVRPSASARPLLFVLEPAQILWVSFE